MFCFWLSLCTQAVLETKAMAVSSQAKAQLLASLKSFPHRTPPWMPRHSCKVRQRLFRLPALIASGSKLKQPAFSPIGFGILPPLSWREPAGAFSGAWQPHPSILEPLGYEQVSSEKKHSDYDNGTKHAMAGGAMNQSQAHTRNRYREGEKEENSLGKTHPLSKVL